jgi:hypothetical protein
MSRMCRAAQTSAVFGKTLATRGVGLTVSCLKTSRLAVEELSKRTPVHLHRRGGLHFATCSDQQLRGKLDQWQSYRLHCETQLVVYYEQNPRIRLRSRYIGCNKLACYLCYEFVTIHGDFHLKGCHQALYSLWTLPIIVNFASRQRASAFNQALRHVAQVLERRISRIRSNPKVKCIFRTNNESTANLSRVSLQWLASTGWTIAAADVVALNENGSMPYSPRHATQEGRAASAELRIADSTQSRPPSDAIMRTVHPCDFDEVPCVVKGKQHTKE